MSEKHGSLIGPSAALAVLIVIVLSGSAFRDAPFEELYVLFVIAVFHIG